MTSRVLKHYRFSETFAWVNRNVRSRRKVIKKIRDLYTQYGLVNDGCSLCGNKDFELIAQSDRYGFDLKKQFCKSCGLIQTYPALSPEFHEEFYSYHYRPLYLKNKAVNYQTVIKEQTDKGEKYLAYLRQNGLAGELKDLALAEVGCSSGGTLNTMKPFVKSAQGCDLDIEAIKFAKENFNLNVEVAMHPSQLPEGKKLFVMSHVLEHVFNPLYTLKALRALMSEGDYLFIAVPGINEVADGDYKNDLRRYFHIGHVTDFTGTTLCNVAAEAGFKTINSDEEVNALFVASKPQSWSKNENDSIENILRIEASYRGTPPHL